MGWCTNTNIENGAVSNDAFARPHNSTMNQSKFNDILLLPHLLLMRETSASSRVISYNMTLHHLPKMMIAVTDMSQGYITNIFAVHNWAADGTTKIHKT